MDGEANGSIPALGQMSFANPLVKMLEDMMVEVKAGRVTSLAIVGVTPVGGVATPWAGDRLSDMHTGLCMMQRQILDFMANPQKRSSIIPARMG